MSPSSSMVEQRTFNPWVASSSLAGGTMYERKYETKSMTGWGPDETIITHKETLREIAITGEAFKSWASHVLTCIADDESRQRFATACRIPDEVRTEDIISDNESAEKRLDEIAEWFYVLGTRIMTIQKMMREGTPPRFRESEGTNQ